MDKPLLHVMTLFLMVPEGVLQKQAQGEGYILWAFRGTVLVMMVLTIRG
jgi:hypothetical protein